MVVMSVNKMNNKVIKPEPGNPPTPSPITERSPNDLGTALGDAGRLGMDGATSGEDSEGEFVQIRNCPAPQAPPPTAPCPGTPDSPPINSSSYIPQQKAKDMRPLALPNVPTRGVERRHAGWHPQIEASSLTGVRYPRPPPRTDLAGPEPRGWDTAKRGGRQYNIGDPRDRRMVTPLPGVLRSHKKWDKKFPFSGSYSKKRPREDDAARKLKVIEKFRMNSDQNPKDILKDLRSRNMAETLPQCCAAVASQLMRPYRIEGIKRFTSEDSDILECVFLPAMKRFATFLSLGWSLEAWGSKHPIY